MVLSGKRASLFKVRKYKENIRTELLNGLDPDFDSPGMAIIEAEFS